MNAQRASGSGDGGVAAQATHALPATLARRGRTLIDAVEAVIVSLRSVTLTERQRAEARDIVRKLIEAIEIDLLHFLPPCSPAPSIAWETIAPRGLPVEGLARHVLARALERGLEDGRDAGEVSGNVPNWAIGDAELADLWMRYTIADRRRRDSWHAPMIVAADLPVETQATLIECVAGALLARRTGPDESSEIYAAACAKVVSLYREETGISITAARLVDAALAQYSAAELIDDLIEGSAWPAIIALVSRHSGADQNETAIFMCCATAAEIEEWLSPTDLGSKSIASLCQAMEMTGGLHGGERDVFVAETRDADDARDNTPAARIRSVADRYRTPQR